MNASLYISVLGFHLLFFMSIHGCTTFKYGSAPCHEAKSVINVRVLKWPGNSTKINPIKNLWILIKKKVSTSNPSTMDEIKRIIKEVWCKDIDQMSVKTLQIPCLVAFKMS